MPYILDADWIIEALGGNPAAVNTIDRLAPQRIAVSVVTAAEVSEVAFNTSNPQAALERLRRFLAPHSLLNVTLPIMERFAEIRAYLRRTGQIISDFDIILGATALHHDLTVLTFNRRHLARIPDLKLYGPT